MLTLDLCPALHRLPVRLVQGERQSQLADQQTRTPVWVFLKDGTSCAGEMWTMQMPSQPLRVSLRAPIWYFHTAIRGMFQKDISLPETFPWYFITLKCKPLSLTFKVH